MTLFTRPGIVLGFAMLVPGPVGCQEASLPRAEGDLPAEEVSFRHGDHVLAGTLFMPRTDAPNPAIVLLAGSGATDRTSFGYFPSIQPPFLEGGIAVLVYDKPGVGRSTGDWRSMTFHDRAEEAIAAVRYLQSRDDILADQVGLWGGSQGGWVAPLAATLSDDVSFVITISAPGISPAEQDVYGLENLVRGQGHPEEVVQQGVRWGNRLMEAAAQGQGFEEVRAALLEPARGHPWSGYFNIPDARAWDYLAAVDPITGIPNVLYDPAPVLARMTTPYLAIFGEEDDLVPVRRSVEIFEKALAEAGNDDFEIVVYPDANHGILVGPRTFAPGYLELMAEWVIARTTSPRDSSYATEALSSSS